MKVKRSKRVFLDGAIGMNSNPIYVLYYTLHPTEVYGDSKQANIHVFQKVDANYVPEFRLTKSDSLWIVPGTIDPNG